MAGIQQRRRLRTLNLPNAAGYRTRSGQRAHLRNFHRPAPHKSAMNILTFDGRAEKFR
jgi:hypothetical protein